ncbi:MAG: PEP-CTERM sorting domain-containing protein [Planctomycetota bacterium]
MPVTISLGLALTAPAFGAVVLVSDDFTDGLNPGYALTGGGGSITIETTGTGLDGNALLLTTTSNNRVVSRGFGSSVTLANDGDFIELGLDYRLTAILDDNFAFEAALLGASGTEGGIRFNPSAANNGGTYFADSDNNAGRFDTIDSLDGGSFLRHSLTLRITRTSATEVLLTASFDGVAVDDSNIEVIGSDIGADMTFDAFEFGWRGGNSGEIYVDNATVTSNIPEPASLLLLGAGMSVLATGRRRSR